MKTYNKPAKETWASLTKRPAQNESQIEAAVIAIADDVKLQGDKALFKYAKLLDGANLSELEVSAAEWEAGAKETPQALRDAIEIAYNNIYRFHAAQQDTPQKIETTAGVSCWRKSVPIQKVGLYIPGGSAPLFSSILMLGIPAQLAGCREVVMCTPPDANGNINPVMLYAAKKAGISRILKIGGAQAIAGMAYGSESVPRVDKIFGPGNRFVTKAKELLQSTGVAIDMPAGPSEVLVIADETSNPAFVAADLLSQAEHGPDSQVMLLGTDAETIEACVQEVIAQCDSLPRKEITQKALKQSKAVILESAEDCLAFSNQYAPEHLILASNKANDWIDQVENAGSVFVGNFSCESVGDYASGTNHTLPTNGFAQSYSGVSLDSFVKKITFQEVSAQGIKNIGSTVEIMADAEGLEAHKRAVSIRLNQLENE